MSSETEAPTTPSIVWPPKFDLSGHPVHVSNVIDLDVSPERVWERLIRATLWPKWYSNAHCVRLLESPSLELARGTRFHWWTFSVPITSTVKEFEPYDRIAWDAKGPGIDAYHAWLITPTPNGCHVLTEERQHGFLAKLQSKVRPNRMSDQHQLWLEGLRDS